MAVRRWDLEPEPTDLRPALELATSPPSRSGHPIASGFLVLALVAALGLPIARSSSRSPDAGIPRSRPLPVTALANVDAVSPIPPKDWPKSAEVVGGVAYVSCTRLWIAHPDGTQSRIIVDMPNLSSPAFAPNGRTIAFVRPGVDGEEIWMAAADGTQVRPVATITSDGDPLSSHVANLAWSRNGSTIAFALVDSTNDPWVDGSAIWTWHLPTGEFDKFGAGYPTPLYVKGHLIYPSMSDGQAAFNAGRYNGWARPSHKDRGAVLMGAAVAPATWFANYRHSVVVLRRDSAGETELVVKQQWSRRERAAYAPPLGHDFVPDGQPSISQDGTRAFVDLIDRSGERDLGVLDVLSGEWAVLDYAWEPTISPAPATSGALTTKRAYTIFEAFLSDIGNPHRVELLGLDPAELPIPMGTHAQFTYRTPIRSGSVWRTTATLLRWDRPEWTYQSLDVSLRLHQQRVVARVGNPSGWLPLETVDDALAFAATALGHPVPRPSLPEGLKLMGEGPVNAWTWAGQTTVNLSFGRELSTRTNGRSNWDDYTTISYGTGIGLSMGCGGSNDPEPIDLGGPPAMADHMSGMHAIVWPATPDDMNNGNFGVSGDSSAEEIEAIARSMVAP